MSRRSPLNNRYKKGQEPKGQTRKSAASAKPARKNATPVKAQKKASVKQQYAQAMPDTPEFKRLRGLWWKVLGIAVVMLVVSLVLTTKKVAPSVGDAGKIVSLALSWIALGLVAFAWWIDLKKVRPLVKAHQMGISIEQYEELQNAAKKKRAQKATKEMKKADDAKEAAKEEAKDAKKATKNAADKAENNNTSENDK